MCNAFGALQESWEDFLEKVESELDLETWIALENKGKEVTLNNLPSNLISIIIFPKLDS